MIKIESLKSYIGNVSEDEFMKLAESIYEITNFICTDYPRYKEWYFHKQLPNIYTLSREILFARSDDSDAILAMACLNKEKKKICTLFVTEKYRGQHLGTRMIEESMKFLGTNKPFITFADYKLPMFKPIIDKYNWELTEVVTGLYNDRSKELCYNGYLTKQNGK